MAAVSFTQYYDLEHYLFTEVTARFQRVGTLNAFDFFCIVIWKANRAKTRVAKRLLTHGHADLDTAVAALLNEIGHAESPCAQLAVLIERWGFRLPMASAILTVLYPNQFTIYDVRVCDVLGDFHDAQNRTKYSKLWERYVAFLAAVREAVPSESLLRNKDRFLWGQSFASQLQRDVSNAFSTYTREP